MTKLIQCPVCKKKDCPVSNHAKVCSSNCRVKQWREAKKAELNKVKDNQQDNK